MPKVIISGEPGEVYTNDTGKVLFQFHCNWSNTCGLCAQLDNMIGTSFPIPLHRGCRCRQTVLPPGATSQKFTDFRETIAGLDHVQQSRVVGRSNLTLIEKGVVSWGDVVTSNRVRDFREVVARGKLSVKEMVKAGVSPRLATDAYATVHTPAHELAVKQRQDALDKLLAKGIEKDQLRRALAERLAARVGIGRGPSGPGALPVTPSTPRPAPGGARPAVAAIPARRISAKRPPSPRPAIVAKGEEVAFARPVQQAYLESLGVRPEVAARAATPTAPILPGQPIAERIAAYTDGHEKVKQLQAIGAEHQALRAEADALKLRVEAAERAYKDAPRGKARQAASDALHRERLAWSEKARAASDAEHAARQAAQDILQSPGRLHIGLKEMHPDAPQFTDAQFGHLGEGLRWLQRNMMHFGEQGSKPSMPMRVDAQPLPESEAQRSYAIGPHVRMAAGFDAQTFVHELGHYLDHVAGLGKSAQEFLDHRVGSEQPRPMGELIPGGYFRSHEVGRKDRFEDAFGRDAAYVGKDYGGAGLTEITAMGIEKMFRDPAGFAIADPEYAAYILGIMHGPLR